MKRIAKWIAYGIGGLIVLLLLAVLILPMILDPNDYKGRIESSASAAVGRSVRIEGDIEWSLFPGVALATGPVTIANASGFGDQPLLSAERISASVLLMPLLNKRIEVGAIDMQSVLLDLQVNGTGETNWEDLGGSADNAPADSESDMSLSVESIGFADATIRYSDYSTQTRLVLEDVSLTTSAIASGQPTVLALAASYSLNDEMSGEISTEGEVRGLLGEQPVSARFVDFELTQNAEPQIRFLSRAVTVDLAGNGTLRIPEYTVRSHNMQVTGSAQSDHLLDALRLSGSLTVAPFALDEWLRATGLYTKATVDASALKRLEGEVDWRVADVVSISRINLTLDDTVLRGSATVGDVLRFELNADQLNAERYLPPPTDAPPETEEAPDEPLVLPALEGALSVGQFSLAGMTASNVLLKLTGDENGLQILPIRGDMYGGSFEGSLNLQDTQSNPTATTKLTLARVNGGELLQAVAGSQVLSGLGSFNANLRIDEPFSKNPVSSLNGDIDFEFRDGRIYGLDVTNVYQQVLKIAGSSSVGEPVTDFSRLGFQARITDGVLQTNAFDLASDVLRVRGAGTINLAEGTLDFDLNPTLLQSPEGASSLSRLEGVEIPLKITGPMTDPSVRFDAAGALLASQQDRLEGKLRDKLGLDDGSADGDDEKQSGLEGLLLDALDKELKKKSDDKPRDADNRGGTGDGK